MGALGQPDHAISHRDNVLLRGKDELLREREGLPGDARDGERAVIGAGQCAGDDDRIAGLQGPEAKLAPGVSGGQGQRIAASASLQVT